MPFEVALFSDRMISLAEFRALAEDFNPPIVVEETDDGGVVTFTELTSDECVLTLYNPKRVETQDNVYALLGCDKEIPFNSRFLWEGTIPFTYFERGMVFLYACESYVNGAVIVRGSKI